MKLHSGVKQYLFITLVIRMYFNDINILESVYLTLQKLKQNKDQYNVKIISLTVKLTL